MKSPKIIPEYATERKTVEQSAAGYHEYGGMTSESVCDNHNGGQKLFTLQEGESVLV